MTQLVRLERPHEGVALVTMDNPDIHNQGSWAAIDALAACLKQGREQGTRVAVLASAVPGHWLQHAWLQDLLHTLRGQPTTGSATCWMTALAEITHPDQICIAAIDGDASGGGAELGWACDLRVAEEQVRFAQPEVKLGVVPGIGGASRLAHLAGRSIAAEMILGGQPVEARRLYDVGAINRLVPRGQAREAALQWAQELAAHPPAALSGLKQQLIHYDTLPLTEALQKDQLLFQQLAFPAAAQQAMQAVQDRFDAGETMAEVYGWPSRG